MDDWPVVSDAWRISVSFSILTHYAFSLPRKTREQGPRLGRSTSTWKRCPQLKDKRSSTQKVLLVQKLFLGSSKLGQHLTYPLLEKTSGNFPYLAKACACPAVKLTAVPSSSSVGAPLKLQKGKFIKSNILDYIWLALFLRFLKTQPLKRTKKIGSILTQNSACFRFFLYLPKKLPKKHCVEKLAFFAPKTQFLSHENSMHRRLQDGISFYGTFLWMAIHGYNSCVTWLWIPLNWSTVCFLDRWPQTKCNITFDTSF